MKVLIVDMDKLRVMTTNGDVFSAARRNPWADSTTVEAAIVAMITILEMASIDVPALDAVANLAGIPKDAET